MIPLIKSKITSYIKKEIHKKELEEKNQLHNKHISNNNSTMNVNNDNNNSYKNNYDNDNDNDDLYNNMNLYIKNNFMFDIDIF